MRHIIHQTFHGNVPKKEVRRALTERQTTFAADLPEIEVLRTIITAFQSGVASSISVPFGMAVVHPDDQFVKKQGVKIATDKMQRVIFTILAVSSASTERKKDGVLTSIQLVNQKLGVGIEIIASFSKNTLRVMIGNLEQDGEENEQHGCQGQCSCGNH